jgi:hypothetical protein
MPIAEPPIAGAVPVSAVTQILGQIGDGDGQAAEKLLPPANWSNFASSPAWISPRPVGYSASLPQLPAATGVTFARGCIADCRLTDRAEISSTFFENFPGNRDR